VSDIAVIEISEPGKNEWEVLAYIGPDRAGGEIEFPWHSTGVPYDCRIRYLTTKE
jgi:hypothetical protein